MHGGIDAGPTRANWWVSLRPRDTVTVPRVRLLVLPHSGSGPNAYRPLIRDLPADVEVLGLNLPGRERRIAEPPATTLAHVIASIEEIKARATAPTVVFGHSLGALLAMRVAAALGDTCTSVIVSGQLPGDRDRWFEGLDTDADLLRLLDAGGGAIDHALAEPAWRSVVLNVLRADLRLGEEAALGFGRVRLRVPITVIGATDDQVIDVDALPGWAAHTSSQCRVRTMAGGHFALLADENRGWVGDLLRDAVAAAATTTRFRLLCLPFAGAGAGIFGPWRRVAPPGLTVVGIQLPGRESRIAESPATTAAAAVDAVMPEIRAQLALGEQVALFGHSMGAVLAYEVARRVDTAQAGAIAHLFVSGSPAPWRGRDEYASGLPDEEFIDRVQQFAGYQHQALAEPQLRDLILPTLRADVELHERYRRVDAEPITTPITALRGTEDTLVAAQDLVEWKLASNGGFDVCELPGPHMYLMDRPGDLLAFIAGRLGLASQPTAEDQR